jgi:hypothetical protein
MKPAAPLSLGQYLYAVLLWLYPPDFRREFGEEMREVFSQAAAEAAGKNPLELVALVANELLLLPAAVLRAHGHARRNAALAAPHLPPLELSWRELLLSLAVFLLPAVMLISSQQSSQGTASSSHAAILFLAIMVAAGFLRGFPLRSSPYFGLIVVVAGYLYLFQWVVGLVSPALISDLTPGVWDRSTYLLLQIISNGMLWLMLFCLTLLVVAILAIFNRFRPLFQRVEGDWTLFSYVLYGESVFVLLLLFETYRSAPAYTVASLLCLAGGAWFYLRLAQGGRRVLALIGGITLAMWIAALGKGMPGQPGASLLDVVLNPLTAGSWSESGQFLLAWAWMVIALLLPALLRRPHPERRT